jgi:glycerophosphoryl diester phosphodiesterase
LNTGLLRRCLADAFLAAPRARRHAFHDHAAPLAIAHRGGMGLWPENTMLAFENAAALGVDALEMDIHRSRDGVLVVSHDPTLERCTNGRGAIADLRFDEIRQFDAGWHWSNDGGATHPYRDRGVTIPALEEVFDTFPRLRMIVDNKPRNPEVALQFAELIRRRNLQDRVIIASFYAPNLFAVRDRYPDICTSCSDPEIRLFWFTQFLGFSPFYTPPADSMQIPLAQHRVRIASRRFLRHAAAAGADVHVWTINDDAIARDLLAWGARGILTDYPDRLLAILGRR